MKDLYYSFHRIRVNTHIAGKVICKDNKKYFSGTVSYIFKDFYNFDIERKSRAGGLDVSDQKLAHYQASGLAKPFLVRGVHRAFDSLIPEVSKITAKKDEFVVIE